MVGRSSLRLVSPSAAFFASTSTDSFPAMLACPGTQRTGRGWRLCFLRTDWSTCRNKSVRACSKWPLRETVARFLHALTPLVSILPFRNEAVKLDIRNNWFSVLATAAEQKSMVGVLSALLPFLFFFFDV